MNLIEELDFAATLVKKKTHLGVGKFHVQRNRGIKVHDMSMNYICTL